MILISQIAMAGEQVPLLSVAQVAVKDTNTLIVTAFDVNDAAAVETAIRASDLGLEPARDAKIVRVSLTAYECYECYARVVTPEEAFT